MHSTTKIEDKPGLDRKRLDYLHRLMLDWGQWVLSGCAVPGLFPNTWPEFDSGSRDATAQPRSRSKTPKPLLPPCQPHSTRQTSPRAPVMVKFERDFELIRPVVVTLDDNIKNIVVCLYLRGMCFADITHVLQISSRSVGDCKYKALTKVSSVVR